MTELVGVWGVERAVSGPRKWSFWGCFWPLRLCMGAAVQLGGCFWAPRAPHGVPALGRAGSGAFRVFRYQYEIPSPLNSTH